MSDTSPLVPFRVFCGILPVLLLRSFPARSAAFSGPASGCRAALGPRRG